MSIQTTLIAMAAAIVHKEVISFSSMGVLNEHHYCAKGVPLYHGLHRYRTGTPILYQYHIRYHPGTAYHCMCTSITVLAAANIVKVPIRYRGGLVGDSIGVGVPKGFTPEEEEEEHQGKVSS